MNKNDYRKGVKLKRMKTAVWKTRVRINSQVSGKVISELQEAKSWKIKVILN